MSYHRPSSASSHSQTHRERANSTNEFIVDRLHGALASYRKERDDLHRKKELSVERLRLAKEERLALEKTVKSMQTKLTELASAAEGTRSATDVFKMLQQEVTRLEREARFQHTELMRKKEKMSNLEESLKQEDKARISALWATQDNIRIRRESIASKRVCGNNDKVSNRDMEKLKKLIDDDDSNFIFQLPKLIEKKREDVNSELEGIKSECKGLERRVVGYKQYIKETVQVLMPPPSNSSFLKQ